MGWDKGGGSEGEWNSKKIFNTEDLRSKICSSLHLKPTISSLDLIGSLKKLHQSMFYGLHQYLISGKPCFADICKTDTSLPCTGAACKHVALITLLRKLIFLSY